jgi:catechol 2,3-dioxygenase-like lactoylglutathione lyase family enzyme
MIQRIAHVCILAKDLEETERFYCGVLGLEKGFEFHKLGKPTGFYLNAGGTTFIEVFAGNPEGTVAGLRHFCLETDDLDALQQRLEAHGIKSTAKHLGCDHSWQIWCKDPNGVDIEFHEYTDRSLQLTGGIASLD